MENYYPTSEGNFLFLEYSLKALLLRDKSPAMKFNTLESVESCDILCCDCEPHSEVAQDSDAPC